jgi:arginyl-tRNA--protein-N-Asp/Glu arginylyltransferase
MPFLPSEIFYRAAINRSAISPMFAEKHHPEQLSPEDLDNYLSKGWYRMGQTIFTTHFLSFDARFYSAIWARLPLESYEFSKSLRKIMRRNSAHFRTYVAPGSLTLKKEALYQKYRAGFPGILAASLRDSLLDGGKHNIYNTYEITVYDGRKLVACSYFDLGVTSAASILGFYDPEYSAYSLGLYTMLAEINYCMQQGMSWFYPGYVVPGYHRFDYKLRIGAVEYFDLGNKGWLPYAGMTQTPMQTMEQQAERLHQLLKSVRLPSRLMYYPLFEANLFGFWAAPYLEFPIFVLCAAPPRDSGYILAVYDVRDAQYKLLRCSPFEDAGFYLNDAFLKNFSPERFFLELLVVQETLLQSSNPEFIALGLHKLRALK